MMAAACESNKILLMVCYVKGVYKTNYNHFLYKYCDWFNLKHRILYEEFAEFDSLIIGDKWLRESSPKKWFLEGYKIKKRKNKKFNRGIFKLYTETPYIEYSDHDDRLALKAKKDENEIKHKIADMMTKLHQEYLNDHDLTKKFTNKKPKPKMQRLSVSNRGSAVIRSITSRKSSAELLTKHNTKKLPTRNSSLTITRRSTVHSTRDMSTMYSPPVYVRKSLADAQSSHRTVNDLTDGVKVQK